MIAFAKRIKINPKTGCWEWTGAKSSAGYGQIRREKKTIYAHRYVYENVFGKVNNLLVCHRCDNPSCVRPSHLFAGSAKDNVQDMFKKKRNPSRKGQNFGRSLKEFCVNGHTLSESRIRYGKRTYCSKCTKIYRRLRYLRHGK